MPSMSELILAAERDVLIEEAVNLQRQWAGAGFIDDKPGDRFRPLNIFGGPRIQHTDVPTFTQQQMQSCSLFMFQANPIARRQVNMTKDFVIGEAITITATDDKLNQALQAFWEHPDNNMTKRAGEIAVDLAVYGEYLMTVDFTDKGMMRVNYISPGFVKEVIPDSTDLSRPRTVHLFDNSDAFTASGNTAILVRGNSTIELVSVDSTSGYRRGEGFFLAVNKAADATRGLSDLLPMIDTLSNLDSFIFNNIERANHMAQWFWDVLYEGSTPEQQEAYYRQIVNQGVFPGAIRVHNEKVTWSSVSPNLQAAETERLFGSLFSYAVTGMGMPPHWTGMGAQGARAGAESAQEPAYRSLVTRQGEIRRFLRNMVDYQIDHLILSGKLPKKVNREYRINMPKIVLRDFQRTAGATAKLVQVILDVKEAELYTDEEAKELIKTLMNAIMKEA